MGFCIALVSKLFEWRLVWQLICTLWLNARQPGMVLNGLNVRQFEIFTEFPLKNSFKLLENVDLRNVDRFQKLCSFAR